MTYNLKNGTLFFVLLFASLFAKSIPIFDEEVRAENASKNIYNDAKKNLEKKVVYSINKINSKYFGNYKNYTCGYFLGNTTKAYYRCDKYAYDLFKSLYYLPIKKEQKTVLLNDLDNLLTKLLEYSIKSSDNHSEDEQKWSTNIFLKILKQWIVEEHKKEMDIPTKELIRVYTKVIFYTTKPNVRGSNIAYKREERLLKELKQKLLKGD